MGATAVRGASAAFFTPLSSRAVAALPAIPTIGDQRRSRVIGLSIDANDTDRRVLRISGTMPVAPAILAAKS